MNEMMSIEIYWKNWINMDLVILEKLDVYGLSISEKTKDQGHNRGEGIIKYL